MGIRFGVLRKVSATGCFLIDLFGWLELMACSLDDRVLFPFPEQ
jgi:hypothetical protein